MYYGVAYYPEQKTEDELNHDLKLIVDSGINTVRMGEFAWSRLEPRENCYDFGWLEKAVEYLGRHGVHTIICTPTACPPAWLVKKHPDILYVDNRKITRPFGGRRIYCYNNETYRAYSKGIALEIAKRFGRNPFVCGFQIDNEPAQEGTGRCACPVCQKEFQAYLKEKYKTIEEYNKRSFGSFWSQEYDDFSEIGIPVSTVETGAEQFLKCQRENPTLRLEFERFASKSQIEYHTIQYHALKQYTDYPVTTNTTGLATNSINYYEGAQTLDCFAFDFYPDLRNGWPSSFPYAFARGIKKDVPFWLLEFQSGGGHSLGGTGRPQPFPGMLKLSALQAMANGAEMLLHFQFRTFPGGAEQLNYAILDMDGQPRRRYYEMQDTAATLKRLEPLFSSKFQNEVAVCFDYDVLWALKIKPIHEKEFDYVAFCERFYHLLQSLGIQSDVISYGADFSRYKMIVLPTAFLTTRAFQEKCKEYVQKGGLLLSTFLTGDKDEYNTGYTTSLPAGLQEVTGVTVAESEPVLDGNHNLVELTFGEQRICRDSIWSEMLEGGAAPLGTYRSDYKKGQMVIAENAYGSGTSLYLGTNLPDRQLRDLLDYAASKRNLHRHDVTCAATQGIEIIERVYLGRSLYFLFNFTDSSVIMNLNGGFIDMEKQTHCEKTLKMDARSYRILQKE